MPQSAADKQMLDRIERDFTYHAPQGDQADRYERLRSVAKSMGRLMIELCPDSRERSLALTQLEQTIMWANAAIARNEP